MKFLSRCVENFAAGPQADAMPEYLVPGTEPPI